MFLNFYLPKNKPIAVTKIMYFIKHKVFCTPGLPTDIP